jgi:hypothetical protein
MGYDLTFGDADAESSFWETLNGMVVEITRPNFKPATYVVEGGLGWDESLGAGCAVLPVRLWDEVNDQPSVDTELLPITGTEKVHIY